MCRLYARGVNLPLPFVPGTHVRKRTVWLDRTSPPRAAYAENWFGPAAVAACAAAAHINFICQEALSGDTKTELFLVDLADHRGADRDHRARSVRRRQWWRGHRRDPVQPVSAISRRQQGEAGHRGRKRAPRYADRG